MFEQGRSIQDLAYELYKVDWMERISPARQAKELKDWYLETDEEDGEDYTFEDFIEEQGYDGELYVCFDEFLDNEYQDEEYMERMLGDKKLIAEYKASLEEVLGEEDEIRVVNWEDKLGAPYGFRVIMLHAIRAFLEDNGYFYRGAKDELGYLDVGMVGMAVLDDDGFANALRGSSWMKEWSLPSDENSALYQEVFQACYVEVGALLEREPHFFDGFHWNKSVDRLIADSVDRVSGFSGCAEEIERGIK